MCARSKASWRAPSARSTASRTRACIWCCPTVRCSRATRSNRRHRSCSRCAARSSRSRCAPSATSSPPPSPGCGRSASRSSTSSGQLLADGAGDDTNGSDVGADERQVGVRETSARAGRSHRLLGRRARPCARAGHRRFRFQPHHPDLGQIRSRRPRRPFEPDPRGNLGDQRRQGNNQVTVGNEFPAARNQRQPVPTPMPDRATKAASRRKSSTTKFPRPPRPR